MSSVSMTPKERIDAMFAMMDDPERIADIAEVEATLLLKK